MAAFVIFFFTLMSDNYNFTFRWSNQITLLIQINVPKNHIISV